MVMIFMNEVMIVWYDVVWVMYNLEKINIWYGIIICLIKINKGDI